MSTLTVVTGSKARLQREPEAAASAPAIDYVSPLPPVRSGISDYSVDLLPHLAALCDVRLVRLPEQPVDRKVEQRYTVVAPDRLGEGGRVPLYQMGNNLYHEAVGELAWRRPGILTLHDLVLHHLLLGRTLGRGHFEPYRRELTEEYGWIGWEVARPLAWGGYSEAPQFGLPAHRGLLRTQRGVLVHSRWAAEQIAFEAPEVTVRVVPMGVPLPERATIAEGEAFRRRLRIPLDVPVLGSLGFQTPMKRTPQIIRALARPALAAAHLIVAGEVSEYLDLATPVREAGVGDRVHITGFLPYEEFHAAVAACDVCFNLRYPTAGETSASLLRILAVGRPVLVSDFAQFSDLPDTAVSKVGLGDGEVEELAASAARLLADPAGRQRMAEAARAYVRTEHDPEAAARRIVDACRELAPLPPATDPRLPEAAEPRRPTSLTWSFLGGALEVEEPELPWRIGEARTVRARLRNQGLARWLATRVGPGGVHVRVAFRDGAGERLPRQRWLRLPRHLDPGEELLLETRIRRPPGAWTLIMEPVVVGNTSFWALGGPVWQRVLDGI
ncbi:MAG: glycosyltransferase [Thermoanaerobaculia bacterium]